MPSRVLLVDDQASNLHTLSAMLEGEGYELHCADNGPDACEVALRLRPDLVLLDVMMPGMDGYEVCRRLRAAPELEGLPVVMFTALNDRASRLEGIRAGADDFISKPFPVDELRARVRTITRLNRYRAQWEQRARFERLFESSPAAILLVRPDGVLVSANPRAVELLSLRGGAPASDELLVAVNPGAAPLADLVREAACRQEAPPACRVRLPARDGERVLQVRAVRLAEGEGPLVLLVLDDITEEHRAREELRTLNEHLDALVRARTSQLEEANRLLVSYAVFVAHDLRSPLSVTKGYLSLLASGLHKLPEDARSCVDEALLGAQMMEELVNNILALVAPGAADATIAACRPGEIAERVCRKLERLSPAPRPVFDLRPLPELAVPPALLERVFFNLVANAIKFSAHRAEPRVEIGAISSPEGPVLYVRDNGVGFASRDAERLFREFSRLPGAEGSDGLGLGLSLVARLVRAYQGEIWADGRPGEGATFFVRFPAAAGAVSSS